ncbi:MULTISPECIES: S8 family serine peptidase [unclassified Lysobacter]|uniref:S8 family serine peptidase n=1 Tax=unclassified Lysobacter TaxID=2635362 RepID=UPI001BE7DA35|nr:MULTISPECIES: S8 family serine peptidase [unclassified Lysobacter]MBT2747815.1 S8 family serine peptidase [Lysobacter sp. ISL-42]MBT2751463.1 S8 family serine peptidase [Lysobacter sp. ISL-50]MBT2778228.1 S8 family serine peptidase [Lysobacter sp. ISL-54]MBT2782725.1 S8 family serine peptidase [Lysobacter sp. ISL-52]
MSTRTKRFNALSVAAAIALAGLSAPAFAGHAYLDSLNADGNSQFIVKYRSGSAPATSPASMKASLDSAASRVAWSSGKDDKPGLRALRQMILPGGRVIGTDTPLNRADAAALMRQIAADPNVEFVQRDGAVRGLMLPNDSKFSQQWNLADSATGIQAPTAWDSSTGTGVVVAVIDSGIYSHTDLNGNILPGYDFISSLTGLSDADCKTMGKLSGCGSPEDGDGRDANPIDTSKVGHGTHVSGIIGALTNNATGIAGVAHGAKILPIRVLGKQSAGKESDIYDAIVWASGGSVAGVPANANPAKVINLSLAGALPALCNDSPGWTSAINAAVANGSTVVASAGNKKEEVTTVTPAGCNNVISVAASDKNGALASYSASGATLDLTAPGGASGEFGTSAADAITSTVASDRYGLAVGTSMAAPHVAGVAALILSAAPTKTPAQVEQILKSSARPIPLTQCATGCGAGLIDAAAAVAAAKK